MSFMRDRLNHRRTIPAHKLNDMRDGATVEVAGLVLVRQRPGTASGIIFATLEDETGVSNKYDHSGTLLFERHIEGAELDDYMRNRPTTWPRRKTADGELPAVRPVVRAAVADASGSLWVSLDVPYTFVYDRRGDKQRVVQFRAAGLMTPTNLSLTPTGRLLATPGCYAFDPRAATERQ
jgi:hypothetical protein